MRFASIASGSSGNCSYIGSGAASLIVDAGISCKRVLEGIHALDVGGRDLDGILITHEHSDHIQGLPVLARKTEAPIYATAGTIEAMMRMSSFAGIDPGRFIVIRPDEKFTIRDITVEPMHISHDAADPVGYRFTYGKKKACICTDLGCYTDYTVECLKDSDVLLVEANHDVNMLQAGRYPYPLKQRILGDRGHLSNMNSGRMLSKVLNDHMKAVYLGHLSEENNMPELAYETVRVEILMSGSGFRPDELPIHVAKRKEMSGIVEF